jgi:hypothetical protein
MPLSDSERTICWTSETEMGSTPLKGSSKRRNFGEQIRAPRFRGGGVQPESVTALWSERAMSLRS